MAAPIFFPIAHYIVGVCFGLTMVVAIAFGFVRGWRTSGIVSHRILYFVALFNCVYAQVKVVQMNGAYNHECAVAENLSVFFYHGSNTLQLVYYISRYKEVYNGSWSLVFPILGVLVYAAGIPMSIVLNSTSTAPDGSCIVEHPRISSLLPLISAFIVSVYMLFMFLRPFVQQCLLSNEDRNHQLAFVARNLFVTNSIAISFNIFFNISLITSLEQYAPLLSMVDLTINYLMVCLPYFLTRLCSSHGSSFQWTADNQYDESPRIPREHNPRQSTPEEGRMPKYHPSGFHNEGGIQSGFQSGFHGGKTSDEHGVVPLVSLHTKLQAQLG